MNKYLFLDFDGVLNTANYAKRLKREGIDLYDEFGPMFDPCNHCQPEANH